jgi:hypothetical protein
LGLSHGILRFCVALSRAFGSTYRLTIRQESRKLELSRMAALIEFTLACP